MKTLFYWDRVYNFGDLLNKDLFKRVFNYDFLPINSPFKADAVAIGSLFQCFYKQKNVDFDKSQVKPIEVYGTGLWNLPPEKVGLFLNAAIVRRSGFVGRRALYL